MQKPLIDNDGEARELTELDLKNAMPMRLRHSNMPPHVDAPQKAATKIPLSIQLSPEVVDYFKGSGKGWQTHIDEILKSYIANHADT
jgi:uncharacterized protein (DUF4415 family)